VLAENGSLDEGATRARRAELAALASESPVAGAEAAATASAVHGRERDPVVEMTVPGTVLWPSG
jgi:hypothetical protein